MITKSDRGRGVIQLGAPEPLLRWANRGPHRYLPGPARVDAAVDRDPPDARLGVEGQRGVIAELQQGLENPWVEQAGGLGMSSPGLIDRFEAFAGHDMPLLRCRVGAHQGAVRVEPGAGRLDPGEHLTGAFQGRAGRCRSCHDPERDVGGHGAEVERGWFSRHDPPVVVCTGGGGAAT